MTRLPLRWLCVPAALLAGCLSSAPPAPPPRFFDPMPAPAAAPSAVPAKFTVRVLAAPHLGADFVVRTAVGAVVFDPVHRWIAPVRELVAAAIERQVVSPAPGAEVVEVHVAAFEVDLTAAPRAHVRLLCRAPGRPLGEIDAWAPVGGPAPGDHAAAMAIALADAVGRLVPLVVAGGG
jgi:hypothetical protein